MSKQSCELYLITPPKIDPDAFAEDLAAALDAGPVACLQLRLKEVSDDEIKRAAEALLPVCHERGVPLLMNDRPDLALLTGCDGAHVGQQDTPYEEARRTLGDEAMIGVTCHNSIHLAMEAAEAGADYVAFGAFYPTETKEIIHHAEIETLETWASFSTVPCVAIGGINHDNAKPLIEAGADFLCVITAVWKHPEGPAAAVKAFNALMAST
ncbi:thiamine phosphate synthase [Nisaea acidiphila]|uniref:Thiamine-phosphate synthase n=1 Tax=Nisaea acidiphila TaxID=1862145 RepID=A0A9J7AZ72_9PROT|nr:thiamine phosphate synthase [Nisaea acidiphila]UUX51729.1 thiamine phosphate synthase [Nisaea acidiphila]